MLPDTLCTAGWAFAVHYEEMSSRQERVVSNISRVFGSNRKWFYTAMIGGLAAYTKYRIEVFTIAQFGIWSCGQAPLTVRTGKHMWNNGNFLKWNDICEPFPDNCLQMNKKKEKNIFFKNTIFGRYKTASIIFLSSLSQVVIHWPLTTTSIRSEFPTQDVFRAPPTYNGSH